MKCVSSTAAFQVWVNSTDSLPLSFAVTTFRKVAKVLSLPFTFRDSSKAQFFFLALWMAGAEATDRGGSVRRR
jgi:hypothetical protein